MSKADAKLERLSDARQADVAYLLGLTTRHVRRMGCPRKHNNNYDLREVVKWWGEQIEEEASTSKPVQELELIGGKGDGLLMLDREMGTRTFTMPTQNEKGA